ncbi:hypothetical protein BDV09DRAFT_166961 [Aspergillus tetrazonus]
MYGVWNWTGQRTIRLALIAFQSAFLLHVEVVSFLIPSFRFFRIVSFHVCELRILCSYEVFQRRSRMLVE